MKARNLMPVHIKQHLASLGCLASIEAADNDTWQLGCKLQTVSNATSVWKLNQSLACAVPLAFSAVCIVLFLKVAVQQPRFSATWFLVIIWFK